MLRLWGVMAAVLALSLLSGFFGGETGELVEYSEVEGKDFVLIWNSGGWGRSSVEIDPDWTGILEGMQSELGELGYTSVVVNHIRSESTTWGLLMEIKETLTGYPTKAGGLAEEVDLLTSSNEELRVILIGPCNGAAYVNEAMRLVEDNLRVYSIQVALPFWYHPSVTERTLVLNDNGIRPDVLHTGDIWAITRANLWRLPSIEKPPGGAVMLFNRFIKAPGHEYTWDHPKVHSEITSFLHHNFGSD